MWSPLGKRERKFCENGLAHMTMVAAMPIYGKIFCRTQSHMILKMPCRIKDSSSTKFDLDLFTGKVTFYDLVAYTLEWENCSRVI